MTGNEELKRTLYRIDGKGYKAYKDIRGLYEFPHYILIVDYVQGDPFASPSRIRVKVPQSDASFPYDTFSTRSREIALRDYLTRCFHEASRRFSKAGRGTGKSGLIYIDQPGQEILERTSVFVNKEYVEARFFMGLPAFGRRIAGRQAVKMFFEELPQIIRASLFYDSLDSEELYRHVKTTEDADFIREHLQERRLVAFVADGAILPRKSGIDPKPLELEKAVSFRSPSSLRVEFELPNHGMITGMGIPEGVTLIVGGGYHGKSTLLSALELGVYNHIPGDGREFVVSTADTLKIRAEDSRRIEKVDISPFISNLPFSQDTRAFSTEDASGSTSQAANIIEGIEAGAKVLLIDEDSSATNFMIRDHRMQELISKDKEPITPFIDKVRQLYTELGISTVLVIGGSGDYFDVADLVIGMVEYLPEDMTKRAKKIAEKYRAERIPEGGESFGEITQRIPLSQSFDPSRGRREVKISSRGLHSIVFGTHNIDLGAVEQLVDISQTRTIGDAIYYATRFMDGTRTLREIIDLLIKEIDDKGLDILSPGLSGDYARFRALEFAAAVNRLRTLRVKQRR